MCNDQKSLNNNKNELWIDLEKVASLLSVTKRTVERQVAQGCYEIKTVSKRNSHNDIKTLVAISSLPAEAQNRYLEKSLMAGDFGKDSGGRIWKSLSPERKRDAVERLKLVNLARDIKENGSKITQELEELAKSSDMCSRHLRRLVAKSDQALMNAGKLHPDLAQALVLAPRNGRKQGHLNSFDPAAIAWMAKTFGTEKRLNLLSIFEELRNEAEIQDWKIGSYESLRRIRGQVFCPSLAEASHLGMRRWQGSRGIKIKRDYGEIWPNFMWVGDHHCFDLFVKYRGKYFRPWITGWLDMRSRALVGWAISARPNSKTIALALRHACIKKDHKDFPMCGAPASVYIDNGKDFRSKHLDGEEIPIGKIDYPEIIEHFYHLGIDPFYIDLLYDPEEKAWVKNRGQRKLIVKSVRVGGVFARLGVRPRYATVYHPWAKTIERTFRNVAQDFSRRQPGWCGSNPAEKPEKLAKELKSGRILELEEFIDKFFDWVVNVYHRKPQSGHGMDGKSPHDVYTE